MELVIDRFEENIVVCQNKHTKEIFKLERKLFPKEAKEGDLVFWDDSVVKILDNTALRNKIRQRMNRLWKN